MVTQGPSLSMAEPGPHQTPGSLWLSCPTSWDLDKRSGRTGQCSLFAGVTMTTPRRVGGVSPMSIDSEAADGLSQGGLGLAMAARWC